MYFNRLNTYTIYISQQIDNENNVRIYKENEKIQ